MMMQVEQPCMNLCMSNKANIMIVLCLWSTTLEVFMLS